MQLAEAYASLGYGLEVPRQQWSAANERGVCVSLWRKELKQRHGRPWLDTKEHCGPHELWEAKFGNRKRIEHIGQALEARDGFVDAVILGGQPGEGYDDADPWIPLRRRGYRWRIIAFEKSSGHFQAEVQKTVQFA